jgi:L-amino acid N-acyltransferase YncA
MDPNSRGCHAGDRARVTLRMLAREIELQMALCRSSAAAWWSTRASSADFLLPRTGVTSTRRGGLGYRIVIEYRPRAGWRSLLDRAVVRHATARTARTTMASLERRFRERSRPADGSADVARPTARR